MMEIRRWTGAATVLMGIMAVAGKDDVRWGSDTVREMGRCSISSKSCGSKGGVFGSPLPCVSNERAPAVDDDLAARLDAVCGAGDWSSACCDVDALDRLSQALQQAQAFIALCPACSISFRDFYCHFTCSPNQSQFVTVSDVQDLGKGVAVKTLDMHVDEHFGRAFFDACKDVKFAATNGYALEFIGGGAKDWLSFLQFMGKERPGLGSPFQINFPQPPNTFNRTEDPNLKPLNLEPLSCASTDPSVGCACADCPSRCLELPPLLDTSSHCHVGVLSCGSFAIIIVYSIFLLSFIAGIGIRDLWARRHSLFSNRAGGGRIQLPESPDAQYGGMGMADPLAPEHDGLPTEGTSPANNRSWARTIKSLVGAGSLSHSYDGDNVRTRSADSRRRRRGVNDRPQESGTSSARSHSDSNPSSLQHHRLGRGASVITGEALAAYSQPRTYKLNSLLTTAFYNLGFACASRPSTAIVVGLVICGALNAGWARFAVERDPVRLWVAGNSELAQQKQFFDEHFGPFYRTEQIFVAAQDEVAPLWTWDRLQWWARVEEQIRSLRSPTGVMLQDICFAPSAGSREEVQVSDCTVQSFMGYFQDSLAHLNEDTWQEELDACSSNPTSCLSSAGQPLNPRLLFGGIPGYSGNRSSAHENFVTASQARAIVITYVVENSLDDFTIQRAAEWERTLKDYLAGVALNALDEHGLRLSFSTEASLEEELNKSSNTDISIVVLSYLLMFVYVSVSLGGTVSGLVSLLWALLLQLHHALLHSKRTVGPIALGHSQDDPASSLVSQRASMRRAIRALLVESKFLLGLFGIAIVLLSVSTSIAVFSIFGIRVTLIIAEVIPFLVLAIGVDNVFILGHELDRQNARAYSTFPQGVMLDELYDAPDFPSPEERVARALGRMGPSILLSASCQAVAFSLGALVGMPAVTNFAIYAAGAVAINALLQVTIYIAAMTIDLKRTESSRVDCFPVLRLKGSPQNSESLIVRFIRAIYAPILLHRRVKHAVLAIFSAIFVTSWVCTDYITLGLDQRLALPRDSYLVDYFDALDSWLDVGPPIYFVTEGIDVEHRHGQQSICGRFSTCDDMSLANILEAERKRSSVSYLSEPPAVWLDDFFQWLNPLLETCCAVKKRDPSTFCGPLDNEFICKACYADSDPPWNITMEGLPEGADFMRYLKHWMESPADADCALGGKASYSSSISLRSDDNGVAASHFRTYHTPLKSQDDYINALASAKKISRSLSERTGGHVFPYSIFYVYFEQYATIVTVTRSVLGLALFAIFLVTSTVLGSLRTGLVVVFTVYMISMNVMGIMGVWKISLNAISLVNLLIAIGIGVEFCSHVARAFMGAGSGGTSSIPHYHPAGQKERDDRAYAALIDVGSSVFSGITLTKLVGISILALTRSRLLEVYYFRMFLTLIITGALHGLVFLPVALSFQGGQGYSLDDHEDAEYIDEIARYRGRPFLTGDDDSMSSDD